MASHALLGVVIGVEGTFLTWIFVGNSSSCPFGASGTGGSGDSSYQCLANTLWTSFKARNTVVVHLMMVHH